MATRDPGDVRSARPPVIGSARTAAEPEDRAAVVAQSDDLQARRVGDVVDHARALHELLTSHRRQPLPQGGIDDGRALELLAEVQASRNAR